MVGAPSFDLLKEILEKDGFQISMHPTPIYDNPFKGASINPVFWVFEIESSLVMFDKSSFCRC
jgi:hypothetical protein